MTKIETAKTKAEKLLDSARKEYDGLSQEIDAYKSKVEAATDEMKKASDSCDLQAYNMAKDKKDDAETALNMYQARADRLEADPLMDRIEYEKLCDEVQDEVNVYFEKFKEDLFKETDKILAMAAEAKGMITDGNSVLHTLQYDVNRGHDLHYNGRTVSAQSVKKVGSRDQWDLVQWAEMLNESALYHEMKEERK